MSAPIFTRLETAATQIFRDDDAFEGGDMYHEGGRVVPDVTGDGIPDFLNVVIGKGGRTHICQGVEEHDEWTQYETQKTELELTKGAYNRSGGLIRSNNVYVIDRYSYNIDHENCSPLSDSNNDAYPRAHGRGILLPEVLDYNGDNKMDISYWYFVGRDLGGYRQIIQLGEGPLPRN